MVTTDSKLVHAGRRWSWPPVLLLSWVVAWGALPPLAACPYSIRDSAFISGTVASPYELLILVRGDPTTAGGRASRDEISGRLSVAASAWLEEANVNARVVDVAEAAARDALPEGFSVPAELPIALLVSPGGAFTTLATIGPDRLSLDAMMATTLGVVESPLRKGIQSRLATAWCLVLLIEGADPGENARARRAFEVAARSIAGRVTEMGKVVTEAPQLISVAQKSAEENLLLWSLGLESSRDADVPVRAVLLVGRGERRGPMLEGEAITSGALLEMFTMLGRSCSCTTDEAWLSGPALPLEWSKEMQAIVKKELGFDPRNPEALGAIKGVLEGASEADPFSEAALGYSETFLDLELDTGDGEDSSTLSAATEPGDATSAPQPTVFREVNETETAASIEARKIEAVAASEPEAVSSSGGELRAEYGVLLVLSGLAGLVLLVATAVVLRRRTG